MPRVLIITYYWPPSGGSAVLRWLKFSKYLRDYGWEPVIYTPENPEPQETDESLVKEIPSGLEVLKTKISEPYSLYKKLTGRKKEDRLGVALMDEGGKNGFAGKLFLWIRSNLFIPDPRRFWVRPSIKFLSLYIRNNPVDAVITSGPPHSMHLIGMGLKMKLKIKWVADFRDPWTNIDFYRDLSLTRWADKMHKKLEKQVLTKADHIITVSPGMTREFERFAPGRLSTVTNGYDGSPSENSKTPSAFSLIHLGSMPKSRNPLNLWKVLAEIITENTGFAEKVEIRLVGKLDRSVEKALSDHKLDSFVKRDPYIPHEMTPELLASSAVLLLCINDSPNAKGILTNKFFEYLAARRPILAIGPEDGDAAIILKESGSGEIFEYNESVELKRHIIELFDQFTSDKLRVNSTGIGKFSRKTLAGQISLILNAVK